jgi:hypothetical protein
MGKTYSRPMNVRNALAFSIYVHTIEWIRKNIRTEYIQLTETEIDNVMDIEQCEMFEMKTINNNKPVKTIYYVNNLEDKELISKSLTGNSIIFRLFDIVGHDELERLNIHTLIPAAAFDGRHKDLFREYTSQLQNDFLKIVNDNIDKYNKDLDGDIQDKNIICSENRIKMYGDLQQLTNDITKQTMDLKNNLIEFTISYIENRIRPVIDPNSIDMYYGIVDDYMKTHIDDWSKFQPVEGFANITEFFTTGKVSGNVTKDEKLSLGIGLGLGIPLLIFLICYFSMSKGQVKRMTSMFVGKRRR